jgi:Na+-transporting NADH:ubiquinone oxidoreductase subunit NqrE
VPEERREDVEGVVTYTEEEKRAAEESKLAHDYLKHVTTLSTGSLVLMVTFLEKLISKRQWGFLVDVSFVSFLVSIVSAVAAMTAILELMHDQDKKGFARKLGALGFVGTWLGFTSGVTSLTLFALGNL